MTGTTAGPAQLADQAIKIERLLAGV